MGERERQRNACADRRQPPQCRTCPTEHRPRVPTSATAAIMLVVLMIWIVRQASPVADRAFGDEQIFEPQETE